MAFIPSKAKKNPPKAAAMPNLGSMMDMMTIILLFLIKSMSTSGALMPPAPDIELPDSKVQTDPQQHLAFIIDPQGIHQQDQDGKRARLLVDNADLSDPEVVLFNNIIAFLDSAKAMDRTLGRPEREIVTLQGDKNTPYNHLYKFITSCGEAGFATIQFIVEKEG